MKIWQKNLLYLLSYIPLGLKMPYVLRSWMGSPYEKFDAILWLILPFVIFVNELLRRKADIKETSESISKITIGFLLVALAGFFALGFSLNAFGLIAGVVVVVLATELRFGRSVMHAQLPAILLVALTIPNLSFWISYFLNISVGGLISFFLCKIVLAIVFFGFWAMRTLRLKRYPRMSSIVFCVAVLFVVMFAIIRDRDIPNGDGAVLDATKIAQGEWVGTRATNADETKRAFPTATLVENKIFYNKNSSISFFAIEVGEVSEIHPPEICMRSAGVFIEKATQIYLHIGETRVQVNEIIFSFNGQKHAMYSYFTTAEKSTGYFASFRLASKQKWCHYQLTTLIESPQTNPRERIKDFISNFKRK